jgi:TrmH family RNA methyltransferase
MITSLNNDRVKRVRLLQSKRQARQIEQRFVIEGTNLLREVIETHSPIDEVYYTQALAATDEGRNLIDALSRTGAVLLPVDETVMRAMSDTVTPQGILGVLPIAFPVPPEVVTFALIIDTISDPGNLGTIMRTATAAGVPHMILVTGTVDVTNPKVVRSAMGAHFRLPVQYLSWDEIARRYAEQAIFLADVGGGMAYFDADWTQSCALILSDEAHGPSPAAREVAHTVVTIPMPGRIESLNVAVAAGILLFEMARQRTAAMG